MTQGICNQLLRTPTPRDCAQARIVNQFFLELYMSAAEPLPHEFRVVAGDGHQRDDEDEIGRSTTIGAQSAVCLK